MPEAREKIVVVLPNHLGDVVMATPALRALRAGRPDAEITGLVRTPLDEVLRGLHSLDRLVGHGVYAEPGPIAQARRRFELGRAQRGADLVLVFPNSFAAALLAWSTGAPRRVGYARRLRGWLLSDALPAPRSGGRFTPLAMERYYLDLVLHLGCPDTGTALELATEAARERDCDALFARHGIHARAPLVCLAPGAGFGPSKLWPLAYVAEVAAKLLAEGAQVALVHGPGETALAAEILARTPGIAPLGGDAMRLSLLKSVIARTSLLICNDAGARHIAAAFGVPTLVMMGPTSPAYTNLNLRKTRLMREPVECSPCQRKVCPIDHRCMTRLLPERVLAEARAALASPDWVGSLDLELRPMKAEVDLSIVIVAWNVRDLVLDCLESICDVKLGLSYEVIVVDNGSADGTVQAVSECHPDTRVLALPRNTGFGAGNNRGLEVMRGRHAVLLNSDTIVLPGGLEACVAYLDAHPEVGVVGPQLLNPDRSKQNCIHNSPTLVSELVGQSLLRRLLPRRYPSKLVEYSAPLEVEAVLGACLFVRREVIDRVGLIDEDYFFFLEETDWCHRIRAAGWKVHHLPDAFVVHLYGESTKKKVPLRTRIEYYRSRDTFFRKNRGPAAYLALRAIVMARILLGCVLGGSRAGEYRKILAWHRAGRPATAGLGAV